ncbi:TPA: hypothetical protein ACH3X3_003233 [Trebouxia sp. C0006]
MDASRTELGDATCIPLRLVKSQSLTRTASTPRANRVVAPVPASCQAPPRPASPNDSPLGPSYAFVARSEPATAMDTGPAAPAGPSAGPTSAAAAAPSCTPTAAPSATPPVSPASSPAGPLAPPGWLMLLAGNPQ